MLASIFGRVLIPYLVRLIEFGYVFHDFDWSSITYSSIELYMNFWLGFANYIFVYVGLLDFQRRVYMIKACGAMITPFKSNYSTKYQLFPTVNISSQDCLANWYQLRTCVMDFGRKYRQRVLIYSSIFFGVYLFFSAVIILNLFGFIEEEIPLIVTFYTVYDVIIVLAVILIMFYFAAIINEQYTEHRLQLSKIQLILQDVIKKIEKFNAPSTQFSTPNFKLLQLVF